MSTMPQRTPFILLLLLFWQGPVLGFTLSGVVMDDEETVADVEIMLTDASNNVVLDSVYTNRKGAFRFSVKPGIFNIGAFKNEYAVVWTRGVAVKETDLSIRIEITPKAFAEDPLSTSDDCE
ncbi:MAG: carboxypeptidase regulatory-like domain-containing protein [gamma proteobacterium endosymbiont of Lamellibrachia anaximandri]|nr:carboxypeptidase regulatory-like domain-containing protein [gamma proteobacterium endosymbiont of Lamellibrachia anaximandri]MBL3534363.1 carboxypeptidase regulatory-like domain-containing protein [gamma proteobacterium endosymbiont of Lamellibrachia anaximandri]